MRLRAALFHGALSLTTVLQAQLDTTTISLDVLHAPSSPGSVLLGMAQNEIERPTDATDFMLSLRQATGEFTALPNNYSAEFAPGLFAQPNLTARNMLGLANIPGTGRTTAAPTWGQRFLQSTVASLAVKDLFQSQDTSTSAMPQTAFGLKFSLCQGRPSKATLDTLAAVEAAIRRYTSAVSDSVEKRLATDTVIQRINARMEGIRIEKKRIAGELQILRGSLAQSADSAARISIRFQLIQERADFQALLDEQAQLDETRRVRQREISDEVRADRALAEQDAARLMDAVEHFKIKRVGFKCDLAGGLVLGFEEHRLDQSRMTKAGGWITAGWETEKNIGIFFLTRFMVNPDNVFVNEAGTLAMAEIHNLDVGARLAFDPGRSNLTFSAEAVYRQVQADLGIEPNWRFVTNAEYDLRANRKLALSFGKNFDGLVTKDGNLITAINLLLGFGSTRKL
ncbi:MAG: hypothetical protein ABI432_01140 [Flavobacteriales bacterium]